MKRVVVLGSTGSIGAQTLDVIAQHPDRLGVVGLAARSNGKLLEEQARRFRVGRTALFDRDGMDAVVDLATLPEADIVVISVAGVIGLVPTVAAIRAGKDIALASKEVLVAAGEIVMPLVREHAVKMTPIDSEHSAIFQCLEGASPEPPSSFSSRRLPRNGSEHGSLGPPSSFSSRRLPRSGSEHGSRENEEGGWGVEQSISELILTASGGPFRGRKRHELQDVTVEEALNHPTWRMGGKITVDSATLMNKGLETIEAKWLFGAPIDRVQVVIHPQSVIHSMVKFSDGSVLAQMGWPNMRLPIQYALLHPDRVSNDLKPWNPIDTPSLTFEEVDDDTFPCIRLARQSSQMGGTTPCAMNAANEEAANAFLRGEINFLEIPIIVEGTMSRHDPLDPTLDNLLAVDDQAREIARNLMKAISR